MVVSTINSILRCSECYITDDTRQVDILLTDSRKLTSASRSLFFAIPTARNTGFRYVVELYDKGVRNFIVSNNLTLEEREVLQTIKDANVWMVPDVVRALQQLAEEHRAKYDIPIIGITGSNGKTIVKDWLYQMLSVDRRVVISPRSYNSQIGVPLSVWQLSGSAELGVFETGISLPGEMDKLRRVINPTIGIFTNIGQAHDENFLSTSHKIAEKLQLFLNADTLIYCSDYQEIHSAILRAEGLRNVKRFTWGHSPDDMLRVCSQELVNGHTIIHISYQGQETAVSIPFVDRASTENALHCIATMLYLGYDLSTVVHRSANLTPIEMRLEMKEGTHNCLLINDGYSLDLNSLSIALEVLANDTTHTKHTLILSDMVQTGMFETDLYEEVAQLLKLRKVDCLVGIGDALCRNKHLFDVPKSYFYIDTDEFLKKHALSRFNNETVLIKGARVFRFEHIVKMLQRKTHETIMEVDLNALVNNLNYYRSRINSTTKMMAMVKASSYGAGTVEVANVLQYNNVDYLTVAYSDEGVELRRGGVSLPIMVMNPEESSFQDIIQYNLEPDIYSFRIFELFASAASLFVKGGKKIPIHIELDTGMHRLGFGYQDLNELSARLSEKDCPLRVQSIFSHLACSEDPAMDDFTRTQIDRFRKWSTELKKSLKDDSVCCHILNSSGITRFPEAQMDMVRLGIGLYGISPEPDVQRHLLSVSKVKTRVSQVKDIPKGDSVGYNRRWIAQCDSRIAIIPIGYADGLSRILGNGVGKVFINGHQAPIIGSICMDMCFVDVTGISCAEGTEVVIFGDAKQLVNLADLAGTISYEVLTSVSPRVKRVYYRE
ncbi:MAG: bifunctional UDP-N-acetylmuramoyl-tripeptide:D-alanyl-D-alanine ligase/alanine racemase [Bacteroidales bacterium]|nr:bifunctional UDP-N-acetylmuramoyl-tripeptide:D-alanyl-D-alanine ligase/alanine racemase [Candidatus Colimorpha onthohippi]